MQISPLRSLPSAFLGNWTGPDVHPDCPHLRVLLADDCSVNQLLGTALLARWGIVPLLASNGMEAVELLVEGEFDIVFMDLEMPVMNGLNAARSIRLFERTHRPGRKVPIIAYTDTTWNSPAHLIRDSGFNALLRKPSGSREMGDCLLRWCPNELAGARLM